VSTYSRKVDTKPAVGDGVLPSWSSLTSFSEEVTVLLLSAIVLALDVFELHKTKVFSLVSFDSRFKPKTDD